MFAEILVYLTDFYYNKPRHIATECLLICGGISRVAVKP